MITAFLFPLSFGGCAFLVTVAALQGNDPQLQGGILASGAIALLTGLIYLRKYAFPRRVVVRRFERTRRGVLAVGLTAVTVSVGCVAFEAAADLEESSTPGALDSQRAVIAAYEQRLSELELRREEDPHDYRALTDRQNTIDLLVQSRWQLRIHETAGARLALSKAVVTLLAIISVAAWISALLPLFRRASREPHPDRSLTMVGQPAL